MTDTIYWYDGFDVYSATADLAMNYISPNKGSILTTGGRFGGGAYAMQGGQQTIAKPVPSGLTDLWQAYASSFYFLATGDFPMGIFGSSSATDGGVEISVTYNQTTGTWKVWSGYLKTVLGSVTAFVSAGFHWVDMRCVLDATSGVVEVWLDDVNQIINLTGIDTIHNGGVTEFAYASPGDPNGGLSPTQTIDDWFISNYRLGDSRVEDLPPTSDASPNDGTPSTGTNHFACVDEPQWNTTDYITMANTSGKKEVYGKGNIVSTPTVIHAVKVFTIGQKSDAGSFEIEPGLISGGVEGDGAAQQLLTTSWGVQTAIFQEDPNTSAPWTLSAANACDILYKVP